jgi:hypothetical protein
MISIALLGAGHLVCPWQQCGCSSREQNLKDILGKQHVVRSHRFGHCRQIATIRRHARIRWAVCDAWSYQWKTANRGYRISARNRGLMR